MDALECFIVEAKAHAYVGGKPKDAVTSRMGSHDLSHRRDNLRYVDSYFGGTDFIGQEVVWRDEEPEWAMNYYGRIIDLARFDGERAGTVIKQALTALYQENRFLGGFAYQHALGEYVDQSNGTYLSFHGVERIFVEGILAYQLDYHGGIIKP